jgi:plastocyanin
MRRTGLLLTSITAVAALGLAVPTLAADSGVNVTDFEFTSKTTTIDVGDTVTWNFVEDGHSSTSLPGQPARWDSGTENSPGATFQKTFTKPGRYQYLCTPHESFMRGTVVVGTDEVAKTVGSVKTAVSGGKVTVSFTLNEPAVVGLKVSGASKRTVKPKRLTAGKRSITVKGLKAGSYSSTLTLSDDFDKKTTKKKSFKVR